MIRRGEVRFVRELHGGKNFKGHRVQAEVCLGASPQHGEAVVRIETSSPEVMKALAELHRALAADALALTQDIVEDHNGFQVEMDARRSS